MYRAEIVSQIERMGLPRVEILEPGKIYEW
jgi:hypothetical protein